MITWLPLLILSLVQGVAYGRQLNIPFLRDYAANVRFLIALPLLIIAETGIDNRLRGIVVHFLKSGLVQGPELASFEAVIARVTTLRDRVLPEVVILVVAYLPSLSIRGMEMLMSNTSTWHTVQGPSGESLSYAGWWFALVSTPFFRFLLLRWFWRMFLWASFLWRVIRIDLHLMPTHADLSAGLGFLSEGQRRFAPIVFASGAVIAAQLGNAIAYEGASVAGLKFIMVGYCAFAIILLTAPLLLVVPKLNKIRKQGLLDYGILVTRYTQSFDAKWVHGRPPESETLLGSADIQSLADLANSYAIMREMRPVPVDKRTLISLGLAAVLPLIPVLILATPAEELIRTLLKLLM